MLRFDVHRINGILKGNNNLNFWTSAINANGGGQPPIYIKELSKTLIPFSFSSAGFDLIDYKIYGNSKQGKLPDGYTQLEYIEATGTQYIDTEYVMKSDVVEYGIKMYGVPTASRSLFGSEADTGVKYTGVPYMGSATSAGLYIGTKANAITSTFAQNSLNEYIIKTLNSTDGEVTLNGVTKSFSYVDGIQKQLSIYLFANHKATGATQIANVKCYSFYIKDNNVLVRNFIPAKRNSDNVLGMYDLVTNIFFTNAGTGEFTAGATLPTPQTPLEIYSVGDIGLNLYDKNNNLPVNKFLNAGKIETRLTRSIILKVEPNTTYTVSAINSFGQQTRKRYNGYKTLADVNNDKNAIGYVDKSNTTSTMTFTTGDNINYAFIQFCTNNDLINATSTGVTPEIQAIVDTMVICKGTTVPSEYVPFKYKIPVKITSSNNLCSYVLPSCSLSGEGKITDNTTFDGWCFEAKKGVSYILPKRVTSPSGFYWAIYADKPAINMLSIEGTRNTMTSSRIITATADGWVLIRVGKDNVDPQINEGTIAQPYEPYKDPIETEILLDEPLRKIGDVSDYIDFENKKVVRNVGKVKLLPDVQFGMASGCYRTINIYPADIANNNYGLSNVFKYNPVHTSITTNLQNYEFGWNTGRLLCIKNNDLTTESSWTEFITNNEVELYYVKTPKTETIDLPPIETDEGVNVFDIETKIKPSKVYIKYYSKDKDGTVQMEID